MTSIDDSLITAASETVVNVTQKANVLKCASKPFERVLPGMSWVDEIDSYIFPIWFAFGIMGNSMILLILNKKGMRSKTNYFLSSMAAADLMFFVFMFPMKLANFKVFRQSSTFMMVYTHLGILCMGCVNWFSAASIWCTVGVTVERLIAVKLPMHAKLILKKWRIIAVLACIFLFTFLLSIQNFLMFKVKLIPFCNRTNTSLLFDKFTSTNNSNNLTAEPQKYTFIYDTGKPGSMRIQYVSLSIIIAAIACTIIPLIILISLNLVLIAAMRKMRLRQSSLVPAASLHKQQGYSSLRTDTTRLESRALTNERRVTITVLVIICSFVIFNLPSASLVFMMVAYGRTAWALAITISNVLVTIAKSINFLLYFGSSKRFRQHAKHMLLCCCSQQFPLQATASGGFVSQSQVCKSPVHQKQFRASPNATSKIRDPFTAGYGGSRSVSMSLTRSRSPKIEAAVGLGNNSSELYRRRMDLEQKQSLPILTKVDSIRSNCGENRKQAAFYSSVVKSDSVSNSKLCEMELIRKNSSTLVQNGIGGIG